MGHSKPDLELYARIKVVGVGGGGGKAVTRMIEHRINGVDFVTINTDVQDLRQTRARTKLHIGKNITRGLGAGMNPDIGRQAAEENRDEIQEAVKGSDMVFITAGLGGGTGSGASPVVAEISRETGALVIGVVTRPFGFEGAQRARIAEEAWNQLKERVDALITIHNDHLLSVIQKDTSLLGAFRQCDDVLYQAVKGIADLIITPGIINVDFADVRAIMKGAGSALMGVGLASGEGRAIAAAKAAVSSPLLDVSINGARGVLFNVYGGQDLTMFEINEAAKAITESIDPEAKVIFGAVEDGRLKKGELKITVIATGFNPSAGGNQRLPLHRDNTEVKKKPAASIEKENGLAGEELEWESVPAFLRRKVK
jgi:cell division protein FtsZ